MFDNQKLINPMEEKQKVWVLKRFFIRSISNHGEKGKQYFTVLGSKGGDDVVMIKRFILSDNPDLHIEDCSRLAKKFKDKYLFEKSFSIKMETLSKALFALQYGKTIKKITKKK